MTDLDPISRERAAHEKRLWVRLTRACNSRCLFCLDADVQDGTLPDTAELKEEIREGARSGCQRLILSGGEPTLHPDYLELIAFGKLAGFSWIQTITNGRMFAYRGFAEQALAAGLHEATVSIHTNTPKLYDKLTGVPGGFEQALQGMDHLQSLGLVVNVDVVINALNVQDLPGILTFFVDKGISEFDLLWMVPFGRAWKNRKELFCDADQAKPALHEALTRAKSAGSTVWTNRLPPELLEGHEELMQDPHKLHDEVRGRRSEFASLLADGKPLSCKDLERCGYCFIHGLCEALENLRDRFPPAADRPASGDPRELDHLLERPSGEFEIVLNSETAGWIARRASGLREQAQRVVVSLQTFMTLSEVEKNGANPAEALKPLAGAPVKLLNLPPCVLPGAGQLSAAHRMEPAGSDLSALTDHYILHGYRVFSLRCNDCSARPDCPGMPVNHVRCYGFGMLAPIGAP